MVGPRQVDFVVCSNKEKDDSEVLEAASRLKIPLVTYARSLALSLSTASGLSAFQLTRAPRSNATHDMQGRLGDGECEAGQGAQCRQVQPLWRGRR